MTTRAVYLNLLSGIDTDSFLMAFRRFSARRGKPFELLLDQGTNFWGGERELRVAFTALHPDLQAQLAKEQIQFRFNPPNAPHFGGCWEREIRSLKQALQATLGAQSVTEEVLRTVLTEIEGILNAKPLGYVSSNVADLDPVTPNSLLLGGQTRHCPRWCIQNPSYSAGAGGGTVSYWPTTFGSISLNTTSLGYKRTRNGLQKLKTFKLVSP